MSNKLNDKYEPILKYTVLLYIENNQPVSSSHLIKEFPEINFSSAKIRYLMNDLEKLGYLEKAHSSSGRIPTIQGLDYYAKYLSKSYEEDLREKLNQVFIEKREQISNTVEQAAEVISEMTGLTLVTSEFDKTHLLKSIDIVPLSDNSATTVLVISNGRVFSRMIEFDPNEISINDLRIAVRIFKEKLINVPINELKEATLLLKDVLAQAVTNYQIIIESFVKNVFNIHDKNVLQNNIYGKNNIILSNKINRINLSKIIDLIENHSVWERIEIELDNEQNTKVLVNDSGAYISKRIETNDHINEISIIGSNTCNFDDMRSALKLLEEFLTNKRK
ncbi:heat-inducible transcriptional repressor HrcA [Mycoplasma sp. NEAQ87857]|uniref:heat-inducible transcriptional repressor HrcA n=1 Tax=Mycoplasma sp. NEAQ87857 TaxID=2683967 RepID=UPI001318449A|nr:heat-inducible transcriptional repressor HrcA [Mycoplasma sp. NEAQ87857]QGZ97738.1 heat-inducible transcriptional repressor HrcA [Mycoplasma sp. NEAQ87857]